MQSVINFAIDFSKWLCLHSLFKMHPHKNRACKSNNCLSEMTFVFFSNLRAIALTKASKTNKIYRAHLLVLVPKTCTHSESRFELHKFLRTLPCFESILVRDANNLIFAVIRAEMCRPIDCTLQCSKQSAVQFPHQILSNHNWQRHAIAVYSNQNLAIAIRSTLRSMSMNLCSLHQKMEKRQTVCAQILHCFGCRFDIPNRHSLFVFVF